MESIIGTAFVAVESSRPYVEPLSVKVIPSLVGVLKPNLLQPVPLSTDKIVVASLHPSIKLGIA